MGKGKKRKQTRNQHKLKRKKQKKGNNERQIESKAQKKRVGNKNHAKNQG